VHANDTVVSLSGPNLDEAGCAELGLNALETTHECNRDTSGTFRVLLMAAVVTDTIRRQVGM
jgi:hypothetical protein